MFIKNEYYIYSIAMAKNNDFKKYLPWALLLIVVLILLFYVLAPADVSDTHEPTAQFYAVGTDYLIVSTADYISNPNNFYIIGVDNEIQINIDLNDNVAPFATVDTAEFDIVLPSNYADQLVDVVIEQVTFGAPGVDSFSVTKTSPEIWHVVYNAAGYEGHPIDEDIANSQQFIKITLNFKSTPLPGTIDVHITGQIGSGFVGEIEPEIIDVFDELFTLQVSEPCFDDDNDGDPDTYGECEDYRDTFDTDYSNDCDGSTVLEYSCQIGGPDSVEICTQTEETCDSGKGCNLGFCQPAECTVNPSERSCTDDYGRLLYDNCGLDGNGDPINFVYWTGGAVATSSLNPGNVYQTVNCPNADCEYNAATNCYDATYNAGCVKQTGKEWYTCVSFIGDVNGNGWPGPEDITTIESHVINNVECSTYPCKENTKWSSVNGDTDEEINILDITMTEKYVLDFGWAHLDNNGGAIF